MNSWVEKKNIRIDSHQADIGITLINNKLCIIKCVYVYAQDFSLSKFKDESHTFPCGDPLYTE